MVAVAEGKIVGAILCGHDGRRGCLYHVCVQEAYRKHGIGQKLVGACVDALAAEHINKINLIAFKKNEVGNRFWPGGLSARMSTITNTSQMRTISRPIIHRKKRSAE